MNEAKNPAINPAINPEVEVSLRRDIQWIALPDGSAYVGNSQHGLVIHDPEIVSELLHSLKPAKNKIVSDATSSIMNRLLNLGFLIYQISESRHPLKSVSDQEFLRRAAPELDLLRMRRRLEGVAGVAALPEIRGRAQFPIVIFGSNRLAFALLALMHASGFLQTSLINRQRALRSSQSRRPSQSRVSPMMATGLPVRRSEVGRLYSEVAGEVAQGAALHSLGLGVGAAPSNEAAALIIVTQFSPPENTQRWMSDGTPHLVISDWEGSTLTVGPLVLPGSTPCANCVDSTRTAHNPYLPKVRMMQTLSEPTEMPASLISLVSGAIALGVMEFYENSTSPWIAGSTEFDALDPCNPRHNSWQFDSSCGCLEVI